MIWRAEASAVVTASMSIGEAFAIVAPARLAMPRVPSQVQSTKVAPTALAWENSADVRSQRRLNDELGPAIDHLEVRPDEAGVVGGPIPRFGEPGRAVGEAHTFLGGGPVRRSGRRRDGPPLVHVLHVMPRPLSS